MNHIQVLTATLRGLETTASSQRMMRAVIVAQYCAYNAPIDPNKDYQTCLNECKDDFENILEGVNDFLALDLRLCISLFMRLFKARYNMICQMTDTTFLSSVCQSKEMAEHLTPDQAQALTSFAQSTEFMSMFRQLNKDHSEVDEGEGHDE